MPDSVTVTRRTGWFSRVADSIKSVVFGAALFVAAFPLLFWNEGRAVKTARSLAEGSGIVVSVSADRVDSANEGRLVHVSAFAKTDDVLRDDSFGISETAIRLVREVEMYQWVESQRSSTEKKLGGGEETVTTYEYSKEWRDNLVDSAGFQSSDGHRNPAAFPYEERTETATGVSLGAFTLSSEQIQMLHRSEALEIAELPSTLSRNARLQDGAIYIGAEPSSPTVGDVRVRFHVVRPGAVSVVAAQTGSSFEPYRAEAGGTLFLLEESVASASSMIETAEANNAMATWLIRGLGFLLMFLGLFLVFRPVAVFGDVVPFVGSLLRAGVGVVSALMAAVFCLITIAVGWFAYRPILAVVLVALGVGAFLLLIKVARRQPAPVALAGPPPLPSPRA